MEELRPWPFPIVKPEAEWSRRERDFVEFMRAAHAEGFRPSARSDNYVAAESPAGRFIEMVFRGGGNGWEVCPRDLGGEVPLGPVYGLPSYACVCVRPPFSAAAHFALEWLRGH